jgi:tetratricopeptide (TPR) repeat protein
LAKLFLSYDRDNLAKAKALADALEGAGHEVWWDLHIKGGAEYTEEIEQALDSADHVIVLWTAASVKSAWVRDEAAAGRDSGRLVPVLLEPVNPPMGFRQFQTIDLGGWSPRRGSDGLDILLAALGSPAGRATSAKPATSPAARLNGRALAFGGAALALLIALGGWWWWSARHSAPGGVQAVAITAADPSSKLLTRDILTRLGALQSARATSLRLVGDGPGAATSDLVLQVGANPDHTGNLTLLDGKDRSLLWSNDFPASSEAGGDLKQRMSIAAGQIVGCAIDSKDNSGPKLDQQTLKLFLNGCAQLAQVGWDKRDVVASLRQVVERAPRFRGGWASLLRGDIDLHSFLFAEEGQKELEALMRKDIASARDIDPDMPEIKLAEGELLPPSDYFDRMKKADEAYALASDNPAVLNARSHWLLDVGRMDDSVSDARRAVALNPLSPDVQGNLVAALLYAGQIQAARGELARAKSLWPGAQTIEQVEYSFELRAGDFEKAVTMPSSNPGPGFGPYSAFRRHPDAATIAGLVAFIRKSPINEELEPGVLQALGEAKQADEFYRLSDERPVGVKIQMASAVLFRPWMKSIRSDPRFMAYAKRLGLVDYWQKSGHWPDFCSEADLPYDCKAEAAKRA